MSDVTSPPRIEPYPADFKDTPMTMPTKSV